MTAPRLPLLHLPAALAAGWPHAAWAGTLGGGGGVDVSPWRVIASLALCLALGAAAILVLRRRYGMGTGARPPGASARRIRVIEQHGLGPQRSVSLIEIDRQTFAALTAPGAATLIAMAESPPPPAPAHAPAKEAA